MKTEPIDLKVSDLLDLKNQQMLVVNPEYQRGTVWTASQKKKLIDSVLRGYPIPLIYLHHIRQSAGALVAERYEVIDGQQRINALSEFKDGAYKLFDPIDSGSGDATRLFLILDKLTKLLRDQKRSKVIGHEAIHLVLFVDSLLDDYTPNWESRFAKGFDHFREEFAKGKQTSDSDNPGEYWLRYGVLTRVNSDRADSIRRRHKFFSSKMREYIQPQLKDERRLFGTLEKKLIYYRDRKRCAVCGGLVAFPEAEFHHVEEHSKGGYTVIDNGALVHQECHPKGAKAVDFAKQWPEQLEKIKNKAPLDEALEELLEEFE